VINDADAAGLAEMHFGAGVGQSGVVLLITIGTGLGSALFVNGQLLPNTEFGHIEINGEDAEVHASEAARLHEGLSWEEWASRLSRFLNTLEKLLWPDLFILGGGVIQMHSRFFHLLKVHTRTVPALMGNNAGLVGAALAAAPHISKSRKEVSP
jgi:polyphosphate glucokinase